MDSHGVNELEYWTNDFVQLGGAEKYMEARHGALPHHLEFFGKYLAEQTGVGVDIGPGLVSIFEFVKEFAPGVEQVIALEPLQDEMNLVFTPPFNPVIRYMTGSGETMPWGLAEIFDFIYCVNVIDHTPNPQAMLDEIWKVLKPGGRVYFHVNFDETLWAGGHYELWNQTLVDERLAKFTLVEKYEYDRLQYHQHLYWAVYTK